MRSSCISWAERADLFRRTLKWGITVWNNVFMLLFYASLYVLWLALENVRMYDHLYTITHIQAVCEKCGCVAFPGAHHESVSRSVWTVCQKEITGGKTWSPVSLCAFLLKPRMQVGLIFPCCSSSVFTCICIRVLLSKSTEKRKPFFTEDRVERRKMILLIV